MQPAALVSIASLTLLCALALAASKTVLSYAAVVASTAVLNATCAKLLTLTAGFHFGLAAGAYLITGLVCMVCNALACACVDTALYAPTVSCIQLVLNMIFGKLVWQDHIAFPLAYAMVYSYVFS